jgi:regulation of enolase protein 1 (concanavalin A-like superfamily)
MLVRLISLLLTTVLIMPLAGPALATDSQASPGTLAETLNPAVARIAPASTQVLFTTLAGSDGSGIVSDDFSGSVLDSSVWSVSDPLGDGSFVMTGTQLAISVGAGAVHDPWSGANTTARVMQPANDTDFELEVKFESDVTRAYQGQGILVQESAGRFLRFDVFSDGSSVHVFSAMIDGATATTKLNQKVGLSAPMWLRVSRTGNVWSLSTSNDGTSFTPRTSFTQTLTVTQVGAFAGNFGTASRPPPAHTALIDYFFNTASPITPEDG